MAVSSVFVSIFPSAEYQTRVVRTYLTTMAAILGAVPLAMGTGVGSELRRPLGITIIGGMVFSQLLTLYTTPVIYLAFERIAQRMGMRSATVVDPDAVDGPDRIEYERRGKPK